MTQTIIIKQKKQTHLSMKKSISLTCKGFIHIVNKKRIEATAEGKVIVFQTIDDLKQAKRKLQHRLNQIFCQSFVQSSLFDAKVQECKKALKDAKKMLLDSQEYFALHVQVLKAYQAIKSYKFSLPKVVANLLF